MTKEQFRNEAERVLYMYSPWLQTGASYMVDLAKFDQHLAKMEHAVMAINADVDETTKREVAEEFKARLIKFISDHGKKSSQ